MKCASIQRTFSLTGLLRAWAQTSKMVSHWFPLCLKFGIKKFANKWRNSSPYMKKPPQMLLPAHYKQLSDLNHIGWVISSLCLSRTDTDTDCIKWRGKYQKIILSKYIAHCKNLARVPKRNPIENLSVCACPSWIHNKFKRGKDCVYGVSSKTNRSWERIVKKPPSWSGNSLQIGIPIAPQLHFAFSSLTHQDLAKALLTMQRFLPSPPSSWRC